MPQNPERSQDQALRHNESDEQNDDQSGSPVVSIKGFDGPLDLLLHLARKQGYGTASDPDSNEPRFASLSIVEIADKFMVAVHSAASTPLITRANWLVTASWLVLLKSRLLLPPDHPAAAAAKADQTLVAIQLSQLAEARALANWLGRRPQLGWDVFASGQRPQPSTARSSTIADLLEAVLRLIQKRQSPTEELYRPLRPTLWTQNQAMAALRAAIAATTNEIDLLAIRPPTIPPGEHQHLQQRASVAAGFTAALELAKLGETSLTQEKAFGSITVQASR